MGKALRFEELEERIAPTVVAANDSLSFTDADGDVITVQCLGPNGSSVDVTDASGGDIDNGDNIGHIAFTNADLHSVLLVYGDDAGATILIEHDITAAGSQDVGIISIGYDFDANHLGTAIFGAGFAVNVGGTLGVFTALGDIDCDTGGHAITAGGNIGLINVRDITLDSVSGSAMFIAGGAGGAGDVSFILCDSVHQSTGGAGLALQNIPAAGLLVQDDVGNGTAGSVTLKMTGSGASGSALLIPVWGGGSVISNVSVYTEKTGLSITAAGAGGDVSYVYFDQLASGVTVSGTADTDLLSVNGNGVGQVTNKTTGGDIGGVYSSDDVGLIQTGKLGNLGTICTGAGNSLPLGCALGFNTYVDGTLTSVKVGGIANTTVEAAEIGSISTAAGGIVQANITGVHGIGSLASKAPVVGSAIHAIAAGSTTDGGDIGSFTAPALVDTEVTALGDITKLTVTRNMYRSAVSTCIDDGHGGYVGGGIGAVVVGGMADHSSVEANGTIGSAKVGAAGMNSSWIYSVQDISSLQVAGDLSDSGLQADGTFGAVKISGDMIHDSAVQGASTGSVSLAGNLSESSVNIAGDVTGAIQVGGAVLGRDGGIFVTGDVASITVKGMIFGQDSAKISVGGNAALVSVGGPIHNAHLVFGSATTVKLARSLFDATLSGSSLGAVSINGCVYASEITTTGSVASLSVKGAVINSAVTATGDITSLTMGDVLDSYLGAEGNLGLVTVKSGDIGYDTIVEVGGNLAGMKVSGLIFGSITADGNLTASILSAGNDALHYGGIYRFTDANGLPVSGTLSVGGTILPGVIIS